MCEGADQEFFELIRFSPGGERGPESTFVTGEAAFGLRSMTASKNIQIGVRLLFSRPDNFDVRGQLDVKVLRFERSIKLGLGHFTRCH